MSPQIGSELPEYSENWGGALLRKAAVLMGSKAGTPGSPSPGGHSITINYKASLH